MGKGKASGGGANDRTVAPDKRSVDELTQEFLAESMEGLDRMERCLTELEVRPGDGELVAEIFRAVHTIKGTTGFLGFVRLERLAHAGENLLGALRDGTLGVSEELISGLLQLMDGLRRILRLIEGTGGEGIRAGDDDTALIAELERLNGAGASVVLAAKVEAASEVIESGAPLEKCGGEVASFVTESGANDKSLRIGVDVLNRMMNLVGDLVLTRNQLLQSDVAAANFAELTRRLDGTTADLRETVMQARMQPVGNLFSKFPRMVRDLAKSCGRVVRVEFAGAETGLDKSLLEAVKDPLTHAVRNAVDHGIEAPEERVLAGKAAEGCVRLRAYQQSGFVVIEIADDGAGIATARVLAKAVERGLVTEEQAAVMSEREALQLIFLPGFSTAAAVTHVSGRGVGMDVVRSNVEKVGGSVEVESRVGLGTTLRLRVPLTLAIVPALVVRSGGQSFALPQSALAELLYVAEGEVSAAVERMGGAEFYRLRERLLPLVWLEQLLGLESAAQRGGHGFYVAVLESEGRRYGLVVDELLAPEEIVVKPLSAVLREIGLYTVLGNGALALILDVGEVAARAGVQMVDAGLKLTEVVADSGKKAAETSLLVFEEQDGERKALPLQMVERIESVPLQEIECVGGRAVLQYRGEILMLEDAGGVVASMRKAAQSEEGSVVTVLICGTRLHEGSQQDGRRSGRVVRRVLDVTEGTLLVAGEVDAELMSEDELALVHQRVTVVCRIAGAADLAEVA